MLYRLRARLHLTRCQRLRGEYENVIIPQDFAEILLDCAGEMLTELHGEVPEDEPTCIAAIPGIPNDRQ